MLSSRFLGVSFLYIFYATGLVAADPQDPFGGRNQFCQSVRTVTVTQTVTPGQPSPSPRPSNNSNTSLPVVSTRPGNVNLDNGATSTGVVKNTKTSSIKTSTKTSSIETKTKTSSIRTSTKSSSIKTSTKSSSIKTSTKTSSIKTSSKTSSIKTNTKTSSVVKNTQTSSVKPNTRTSSSSVNTITSSVKNVNTSTRGNVNTNTKNTKTSSTKTNTRSVNTKTGSTLTSSTGLPTASPPPVSSTDSSFVISSSSSAAPPANTDTGNPSTSLTLDPSVIQNVDGKGQAAGEADSLVSPNNFIGFCAGKTLTNGKQVQAGSCNPTPIGDIPSVNNMPSAKFNFPKNFDTLAADTPFTVSIEIRNMVLGTFTNAANTYYAAPQQLVGGIIQGHSHVTVQKMTSLDSPEPLNPKVFAFFKGLNAAGNNGILTANLPKGLPAGVYRISSINSAGNHQEVLGPVAQRGSFNDAVYITVTEGGKDSVSSSAVPPPSSDIPSSSVVNPASSSIVDPTPSPTGRDGGRPETSSTTLPVSTGTGGEKDDKGGDAVPTPAALPETTTPAAGNGKTDTKDPVASPGPGNRQNLKRVHRRSRHA